MLVAFARTEPPLLEILAHTTISVIHLHNVADHRLQGTY